VGRRTDARSPEKPAAVRTVCKVFPSASRRWMSASDERVPDRRRLPRQPTPKRVGSSEVKWISSIERMGRNPLALRDRMASSPPRTPTTPSNLPAYGIASIWEPVATAGKSGRDPSHWAKVFPTASTRTARPASLNRSFNHFRARRSCSLKTIRVTAGGSTSEMAARASISCVMRA